MRYRSGGTSGPGSFGRLACFKADFLNRFVLEHKVATIIDFGCGDGNQLALSEYPNYIGLDVSITAVRMCSERFGHDRSKSFFLYDSLRFVDNAGLFRADACISLDVVFHLVEDPVYLKYMADLFRSASRFVVIYSPNEDKYSGNQFRQRRFTNWVDANVPEWKLREKVANLYPFDPHDPENTSMSEFFVFERV